MDPTDYQRLRELFDEYLRMYSSRDDRLTARFSDDFSGFTGGGDFLVKDREKWVAITRQDFAQVPEPIHIELKDLAIQSLAETIAVTTGFFTIHLPIKDHVLSREMARLVLIFRKESAGWKIAHSSISIPYHLVREGEVYPLKELVERNRFLEELVAERTVQLSETNDTLRQINEELAREIVQHKQADAEKEKLESENRQLQKSESLGRMAGAIAHHFNNQLHAVMMNLEYAIGELPADKCPVDSLTDAMRAAQKAAEVSSLMLTYLGQTQRKLEPLRLSDACQKSLPMLRAVIPKSVTLETDFPTPGPVILANSNQIQQVLTNLVTNAWEACAQRQGVVRLRVKLVAATEVSAANRFPVGFQPQGSDFACLEVADTGCGIVENDLEKLFDPFFSTKFTGRGLGLPVVLGIVRAHGGVITVESASGRGSIFRVFLPVVTEAVPEKSISAAQRPRAVASGAVLVVEDEMAVRKAVARGLRSLGFTVLEAADGVEALEVCRQNPNEIDCVLCDMTMPRMGGWETLNALRQVAPGVPVILASGHNESQVMAKQSTEQPEAFLSKPYELKALSDAIAHVLKRV